MTGVGTDYFYGAYIKFVLNNSGGGSGSGTPQTGDWLGIVLISLLLMAIVAASVFAFVKRNSVVKIAKSISAKSGTVASAISSRRIIIAAVIAIGILLIAAITFSSKAFAEPNDYNRPAAPPFKTVEATMDSASKTVSIPTVHIIDNLQPEGATAPGDFWAGINSFSIKPLNGLSVQDLGTWTVYLDGRKVYEGSAAGTIDWRYFCENKGQCSIDISVCGLSDSAYDMLNGQIAIAVQFGVGQTLVETQKLDETYKATVNFENGGKALGYSNYESFIAYMCDVCGWDRDVQTDVYFKEFSVRTSYDEILSDWHYALNNGMFTSDSIVDFYNWVPDVNKSYSKMLFSDETFKPVWYPEEKIVNFKYLINEDAKTTAYWEQVKSEHPELSLKFEKQPKFDAPKPTWQITGNISNRVNIDELNAILNQNCFILENSTFNGWDNNNKMIFDIIGAEGTYLENSAVLNPILVTVNGNIVDGSGNPQPNISVTFEPRYIKEKKVKLSNGADAFYSTTTDANGAYIFSCPKGKTGIFRFGGSYHSTTEHELVGESIIVESVEQQTLSTIVLKKKATLKVTTEMNQEESNAVKLDSGTIKFITTDSSGAQKVFYAQNLASEGDMIEVFANVPGKIVYESSLRYGETIVENTGEGTSIHKVIVSPKTPEMSDCKVTGQVLSFDLEGKSAPLANATIQLVMSDAYVDTETTITVDVTTDANGYYELNSFQNLYVKDVIFWDPLGSGEKIASKHYDAIFFYGDVYKFDITLLFDTEYSGELNEAA